ncbi:MAG: DUF4236 domain-containing protein [Parvibaculaceae bacterium]|nr:DUF4236 domain-containing protein [Parvibaculaceae bacterium]
MPFYFRKSVTAGPFRFNFSKGGVGMSVGVRGLRIGSGPRGHYVHAGRGGIYYRASTGHAGKRPVVAETITDRHDVVLQSNGVSMIEVDSGDVLSMRNEAFKDVLDEINAKRRLVKMSSVLGWIAVTFGVLSALALGSAGFIGAILMVLTGWAVGRWLDSYRRTTVLFYDLDASVEATYKQIVSSFDGLMECAGKWHIEAGGVIQDLTAWKQNAGASHLVKKKPTTLAYKLPGSVTSNITPPILHVGKQIIYFFPDIILIEDGKQTGAVSYADLRIRWQDSNFIEAGTVPHDAKVIGHTWKHPNKSGGPDRRFKDNRQIPICLYETIHFSSDSGINELVEFSKTGRAAAFVDACRDLSKLKSAANAARRAALPSS